jgi:pyruvate dehydrogenase phosphatase
MRAEHPGEPNVVMNGRVLGGLEPTRAFGDAIYKWTKDTQDRLKENYFGRTPSKMLKTPPYVTAEPVITTTEVQPEKGDFVVLATDGLWEMLTNEEVVGLVGQWLDVQSKQAEGGNGTTGTWLKGLFGGGQKALPVEPANTEGSSEDSQSGQRRPVRQDQWRLKTSLNDRFVVEDKNAATHLVRNALGGKDQDQLCALLTLPSPYSRRYRYVYQGNAGGW